MQPWTIFLLVHVGSCGWSDQHFVLGTRSATDQYNSDEQCFFEENTKFGVFNCPGNFFSRNFDFAKILQSRKVSLEKVIVRYLSFLVLSYKPPLPYMQIPVEHQTKLVPVSWTIFSSPKIFFAKTHGYILFFWTQKFAVDLLISWSVRWRKNFWGCSYAF